MNFLFSLFLFSQLWRTLACKLMQRPVFFITYFQIVHVHQVLRSEYFFQKFYDRFTIISIFLSFNHFCEKIYEKTYQFYDWFSKFLSWFTRSQNLVISKFLRKQWRLFQNVNNLLLISANVSNICDKTYGKTYDFFSHILKVPLRFYIFTKFHDHHLFLKKMAPVSTCQQNLAYSRTFEKYFRQKSWKMLKFLWRIFQVCFNSYTVTQLLRPHFYNKNDRVFNFANKLLLISNNIFFTPCF